MYVYVSHCIPLYLHRNFGLIPYSPLHDYLSPIYIYPIDSIFYWYSHIENYYIDIYPISTIYPIFPIGPIDIIYPIFPIDIIYPMNIIKPLIFPCQWLYIRIGARSSGPSFQARRSLLFTALMRGGRGCTENPQNMKKIGENGRKCKKMRISVNQTWDWCLIYER